MSRNVPRLSRIHRVYLRSNASQKCSYHKFVTSAQSNMTIEDNVFLIVLKPSDFKLRKKKNSRGIHRKTALDEKPDK